MEAVLFPKYGGIDVLRYEDAGRPRPGPGEVLVQVAGTAFNPVDTWLRAGIIDQVFPVTSRTRLVSMWPGPWSSRARASRYRQ